MATGIRFTCPEVGEAARLILERFGHSSAYAFPMQFALAIGQRVCFKDVALTPPSIDIGVNDGSTASIVHYGKPRFTWGGDMPEKSALFVTPDFNVYENLVGLDVASAVPFPDDAFNSISATEVFSYGVDRDRVLSELTRVLAPGGTLAFSESAADILNFPALVEGLKQHVPSLDILPDAPSYYRHKLKELGLTDVTCRLYFDRPLAGLLLGIMYAADPAADHARHRRLLVEDRRLRGVYTDGLLAMASAIDEEFSRPEGPPSGWHVFVSARKPGRLNPDRPPPQPRCPVCRGRDLESSLLHCRCRYCGRSYTTRYGIPYLLRDTARLIGGVPTDQRIDRVLRASYPKLFTSSDRPGVRLMGIDPTTAFTVRHLRHHGVEVLGVGTTVERWVGREIHGAPIERLEAAAETSAPVVLSGYPGAEVEAIEALARVGFLGTVYSLEQGTAEEGLRRIRIDLPKPAAEAEAASPIPPAGLARRLVRRLLGRGEL
ncbi:MAG TPA: methyltransferase domain-containing protein [Methylomirabilota bacterium]